MVLHRDAQRVRFGALGFRSGSHDFGVLSVVARCALAEPKFAPCARLVRSDASRLRLDAEGRAAICHAGICLARTRMVARSMKGRIDVRAPRTKGARDHGHAGHVAAVLYFERRGLAWPLDNGRILISFFRLRKADTSNATIVSTICRQFALSFRTEKQGTRRKERRHYFVRRKNSTRNILSSGCELPRSVTHSEALAPRTQALSGAPFELDSADRRARTESGFQN
jgi:hypothetical protein